MADIELTARPSSYAEQRRASRKSLRLTCRITLPDGTRLEGQTADIAQAGIGFFCPSFISVGADCKLEVSIDACGADASLNFIGRVCHCTKQSEDRFRIGMKFVRMDEATARILCAALRNL